MNIGTILNYLLRFLPILSKIIKRLFEKQTKSGKTISTAWQESFFESLAIFASLFKKPKLLEKIFQSKIKMDITNIFKDDVSKILIHLAKTLESFGSRSNLYQSIQQEYQISKENFQKIIKENLYDEINTILKNRDKFFPELKSLTDYHLYLRFKEFLPVGNIDEKTLVENLSKACYDALKVANSHCHHLLPLLRGSDDLFIRLFKEVFYYHIKQQPELANIVLLLRQEQMLKSQEELAKEVHDLVSLLVNKETSLENHQRILKLLEKKYKEKAKDSSPSPFLENSEENEKKQSSGEYIDPFLIPINSGKTEMVTKEVQTVKKISNESFSKILQSAEEFCKEVILQKEDIPCISRVSVTELKDKIESLAEYQNILLNNRLAKMSSVAHSYIASRKEYFQYATKLWQKAIEVATDSKICGIIHFDLFLCYLKMDDFENAKQNLQKACEIDQERFSPFDLKNFKSIEILGSGAIGVVFKAIPIIPDHASVYAIKIGWYGWKESSKKQTIFQEALLHEIECLQKISQNKNDKHSNIVQYIEHGMYNNRLYLVMEYFDGKSLLNLIEEIWKGTPISLRSLAILQQILQGITESHLANLFYLDLNLHNILFNPQTNAVRLIDMTPKFIALEQEIERRKGVCADVFLFGKIARTLTPNIDDESQYSEAIVRFKRLIESCLILNTATEEKVGMDNTIKTVDGIQMTRRINDIQSIRATLQQISIDTFCNLCKIQKNDLIAEALKWYTSTEIFPELIKMLYTKEDISVETKTSILGNFLLNNSSSEIGFDIVLPIFKSLSYSINRFQFIRQYAKKNPQSKWVKTLIQWLKEIYLPNDSDEYKYQLLRELLFGQDAIASIVIDAIEIIEEMNLSEFQKHSFYYGIFTKYPSESAIIRQKLMTKFVTLLHSKDSNELSEIGTIFCLLQQSLISQNPVEQDFDFMGTLLAKILHDWQSFKNNCQRNLDDKNFFALTALESKIC